MISFAWFDADHRRGFNITDEVVQRLLDGRCVRASIELGGPAPMTKKVLQIWLVKEQIDVEVELDVNDGLVADAEEEAASSHRRVLLRPRRRSPFSSRTPTSHRPTPSLPT